MLCESCPPGSFSLGGGVRVENWTSFPLIPERELSFQTSDTLGWTVDDALLVSGAIGDNESTQMTLKTFFVTDGEISFEYLVSTERRFDVFEFAVDGTITLTTSGISATYERYSEKVPRGHHTFSWTYRKDVANAEGLDRVSIRAMEVKGVRYADSQCIQCAPGSESKEGASVCTECKKNFYSEGNGSACKPCADSEYSAPGSSVCTKKPDCTEGDMEAVYGDCEKRDGALSRTKTYRWKQSAVCIPGSAVLPSDESVPCAPCGYGTYMDQESAKCVRCPDGSALIGTECVLCAAGTSASPRMNITEFTSIGMYPFLSTSCVGNCDGAGWDVVDGKLTSGMAHSGKYTSTLTAAFELGSLGKFSAKFELKQDTLRFVIDDLAATEFKWSSNFSVPLPAGKHTVTIVYENRNGNRANITELLIYGVAAPTGTSESCDPCADGFYSPAGSNFCSPCPAGTHASADGSECTPCPVGQFSARDGAAECLECDRGTTSAVGAKSCEYTCGPKAIGGRVYDISPLQTAGSMAGPVYDEQHMAYYVGICDVNTSNETCFDSSNTPISGFACQITNRCVDERCEGVSLGDVIGFYPLSGSYSSDQGLVVRYSNGTPCADGKKRSMNVTILCDPSAGKGEPLPPPTRMIETESCGYNVVWKSIYGCPVCSEEDIEYTYTPCVESKRQKIARWRNNPKRCHGGIELPAPETVATGCTTATICSAGEYVTESGECEKCAPGTFSVGPALYYKNVAEMPNGFSAGCDGENCTPFSVSHGVFVSGAGTSTLKAVVKAMFTGEVTFKYHLNVPGTRSCLKFFVDEQLVHTDCSFTSAEDVEERFPLVSGSHVLSWVFVGGVTEITSPVYALATIKSITIGGADYSSSQCTPCPEGQHQPNSGSAKCLRCPANTRPDADAVNCIPCPEETYSFPGGECVHSEYCKPGNFSLFTGECEDGNVLGSYVGSDPMYCVSNEKVDGSYAPTDEWLPCTCPESMHLVGDKCVSCAAGKVYDAGSGECTDAPAGTATSDALLFFPTANGMRKRELPAGWTTSCVGECIDGGMAVSTHGVTPFASSYAVGKRLKKSLSFAVPVGLLPRGGALFYTTYGSLPSTATFAVYVDGIRQVSVGDENKKKVILPLMPKEIVFAYSQTGEVFSSGRRGDEESFSFSDVYITGIDPALGDDLKKYQTAYNAPCEPGSVSSEGQALCTKCGAGSFQSLGSCQRCGVDSFAPVDGLTECYKCYPGTVPSANQTYCVIPADVFVAEGRDGTSVKYNFTGAPVLERIPLTASVMLSLSVSAPLHVSQRDAERAQTSPLAFVKIETVGAEPQTASFGSRAEITSSGTGVTLVYRALPFERSADCETSQTATLIVACGAESSVPRVIDPELCASTVLWSAVYGCPVCGEQDYELVVDSCSSGKRVVRKTRKETSLCNGDLVVSSYVESCSDVQVKKWWVFAVIGLFVVLVVVLVVVVYKHIQMKRKYDLLIEQHPEELDEFDTPLDDDSEIKN